MSLHEFFAFAQPLCHSFSLFIAIGTGIWWVTEMLSMPGTRQMPTWLALVIVIGCYLVGNCMPWLLTMGYMADLFLQKNEGFIEVFGMMFPVYLICGILLVEEWKRTRKPADISVEIE